MIKEKAQHRRTLLSNEARIAVPWVKVTIGDYTFGVFDRKTRSLVDQGNNYTKYDVQFPNYIQSLSIVKINGQVNQYTLQLLYPVTATNDPNFFEKVFSSVSASRKIVFTYGDASVPAYIYKDEEAIITKVSQNFNLEGSSISYTISAISSAVLTKTGHFNFINITPKKPSDEIKRVLRDARYGLKGVFTGMSDANIDRLIAGSDKAVTLEPKLNISPLDYISYLVGCMVPASSTTSSLSSEMYILTIHDDIIYESSEPTDIQARGPYFKVTKTSTAIERGDAYEVDIGINTSTIVQKFSIDQQENFSLFFEYNSKLTPEQYSRRLNNAGQWEDVYAPMYTSGNDSFLTREEDTVWYTKLTKYPISATLELRGLLRPAHLMQNLRLNVIFPGGNKHISSGLYIITKQIDTINLNGYTTSLGLTRIAD